MKTVLLAFLLIAGQVCAKELRTQIAVIDTGYPKIQQQAWLCKSGHMDFTKSGDIADRHGHGTNVSYLITQQLSPSDYCLVIVKWCDKYCDGNALVRAIEYAATLPVQYVNISAGGIGAILEENLAVEKMLKKGMKVVVAAGNFSQNLDQSCNYFPACYNIKHENFYVVGAYETLGKPAKFSNYGFRVRVWADGVDEGKGSGYEMDGTSQATANYTNELLRKASQ
jgi:hypothetical protein